MKPDTKESPLTLTHKDTTDLLKELSKYNGIQKNKRKRKKSGKKVKRKQKHRKKSKTSTLGPTNQQNTRYDSNEHQR